MQRLVWLGAWVFVAAACASQEPQSPPSATASSIAAGGSAAGGSGAGPAGGGEGGGTGGTMDAPRVLVVADDAAQQATDLQTRLLETGAFSSVEIFDVSWPCTDGMWTGEPMPLPAVAEMLAHDVVLVFSYSNPRTVFPLGDRIADYLDAGGRVVMSIPFVWGRFEGLSCVPMPELPCDAQCTLASEPYSLFQSGGGLGYVYDDEADALVPVDPSSPLLAGVSRVTTTKRRHASVADNLAPGATVVASWASDGEPLIAYGEVHGQMRVDLNFYALAAEVDEAGWTGDGIALLRNALLFAIDPRR